MVVDKESRQPVPGPMNSIIHSTGRTWDVPSQLQHDAYFQSCTSQAPQASHKYENNSRTCSAKGKRRRNVSGYFNSEGKKSKNTAVTRKSHIKSKGFASSLFGRSRKKTKAAALTKTSLEITAAAEPLTFDVISPPKGSQSAWSVISLQKASGSWNLTEQLVSLCGVSRYDSIKGCPGEIAAVAAEGKLLWATTLALVLLMGKYSDQKDEWEMIAEKGKKWLKKNLPSTVTVAIILETAAATVGVEINSGL